MWLCLLMCLLSQPNWSISETGVFQPLNRDEVIVAPTGEVYVLNFEEATISRFDKAGAPLATIGSKGKGPGELMYPTQFFLQGEQLLVIDVMSSTINIFSTSGDFVERVHLPRRGLQVVPVANGWVYGDWAAGDGEPQTKPAVYWADAKFEQEVKLLDLDKRGKRGGLELIDDGSGPKAAFYPISTEPRLAAAHDGQTVYVGHPDGFKISVIDVASRKVKQTFTHDEKGVPFDEAWAEKRLAEMKEMMRRRGHQIEVQTNFPETFPVMRDMFVDAHGRLVVDKWVGDPENHHHFLVCDPAARKVKALSDWKTQSRMVGAIGDWVYVTVLDPDSDEAGVVRCKAGEVTAFVEAHPINFDGSGGRTIAIEQ